MERYAATDAQPELGVAMKDMLVHLKKLRTDAAECIIISNQADEPEKRQLFAMLAQHLTVLADEVQREIDRKNALPVS